ncbi:MAG: hypothetical protein B6D55_02195 [Candidatus Omnitrophica bacterium 4484_70.2]|nr:MAG: hypothetical protein B6D55_02195 [Candidatus Omnitrophica bacterium 4484_70.2]
MEKKVTAVVLAAGRSKRVNTTLPKVLFELAGRPLIFYILETLFSLKRWVEEVIVILGNQRENVEEVISKEFKDVRFCYQKELNGTAKAVESAKELLEERENVLILCGDTPLITVSTLKDFIRFFFKERSDCVILTSVIKKDTDLGRVCRDQEGKVKEIVEKVEVKKEKGKEKVEVNSGIYCFKREKLFQGLSQIKVNRKKNEFFLTDIVKIFYNWRYKISSWEVNDWREILGVNTQCDFSFVGKCLNERLLNNLMKKGVRVIDPSTTFVSFNTKIGRDSVIYPFTYIEKNVSIGKNCRIGPFAHLREDTVIGDNTHIGNFTEVNRCRLGRNVRMKHFSYLGDTIVGNEVNIGAGTVVANYDGRRKHKTSIEKRAFVGSGTVIVAPCKVGKEAITGAGSVVTRDVKTKSVVVGVPARMLRKRKGEE